MRKVKIKGSIYQLSGIIFLKTRNETYNLGFLQEHEYLEKKGFVHFKLSTILTLINTNKDLYQKVTFI